MFEYIFWDGMGECSSVVEHIPSMRDALDLISRRAKKKKKKKKRIHILSTGYKVRLIFISSNSLNSYSNHPFLLLCLFYLETEYKVSYFFGLLNSHCVLIIFAL
jgi:hypothetical protein